MLTAAVPRRDFRLAIIAALLLAAPPAMAQNAGTSLERLYVREAKVGVKQAADAMATAIESRGLKLIARLDHGASAKSVGLDLRPSELILFVDPKIGTPLMQANPEIGIELPLKVLIWQDAGGKVWVGHVPPATLKERFSLSGRDAAFKAMAETMDALTAIAASGGAPPEASAGR
jgi:uncharacterized protein (DUF302 family)